MIQRLKMPGESDIDAMLRLSVTAAAWAFTLLLLRILVRFDDQPYAMFWLVEALWWAGFGTFFALALASYVVAAFIWIRGEMRE